MAPAPSLRGRSSTASPHSNTGVIVPQPSITPDPTLEPFVRQGLTPAQAYQAQVFANQGSNAAPRLGSMGLSDNGGKLDLDFSNDSPIGEEILESELPWISSGQRTRLSLLSFLLLYFLLFFLSATLDWPARGGNGPKTQAIPVPISKASTSSSSMRSHTRKFFPLSLCSFGLISI